jgi:hypothetical protein
VNAVCCLGVINDFTKPNLSPSCVHFSRTYYLKSLEAVASEEAFIFGLTSFCTVYLFSSPSSCRINTSLGFGRRAVSCSMFVNVWRPVLLPVPYPVPLGQKREEYLVDINGFG